jgi:hypothetical protein
MSQNGVKVKYSVDHFVDLSRENGFAGMERGFVSYLHRERQNPLVELRSVLETVCTWV